MLYTKSRVTAWQRRLRCSAHKLPATGGRRVLLMASPLLRLRTAPGVSGHVNEHATGVYGWKTGASTTSVIGASAAGVQGVLACPSPEIV